MTFSAQTQKTLGCSIISAILCGLTPGELIFWMPGFIFGVLFSMINMRKGLRAIIYVTVSGAIYIGAVQIFFRIWEITEDAGMGGLLAGLFGSVLLAVVTKFLGGALINFLDESLTAFVGAILGNIFVLILFKDLDVFSTDQSLFTIRLVLAFIVWQIPISWLLTHTLQKRSHIQAVPAVGISVEKQ